MRRFTMFRRNVPTETHDENQRNLPDEPAFEGVVFSDGRVAVRWMTAVRSVSVWDSLDDLLAIHGHPEYGSELVFTDWFTEQRVWPTPSWWANPAIALRDRLVSKAANREVNVSGDVSLEGRNAHWFTDRTKAQAKAIPIKVLEARRQQSLG